MKVHTYKNNSLLLLLDVSTLFHLEPNPFSLNGENSFAACFKGIKNNCAWQCSCFWQECDCNLQRQDNPIEFLKEKGLNFEKEMQILPQRDKTNNKGAL